jgi:prepilin signal peptidase PulO-like enzyme (type II secretory pathway)
MVWIAAAILGWLAGVLVNLAADTLPTERRLRTPRCPACGAPRSLAAWSGLLGVQIGEATCAYCGRRRGWRPVLVEGIAVIGALFLLDRYGLTISGARAALICSVFLLITVTDIEHRLVLHAVSVPAAFGFAILAACDPSMGLAKALWGGLAGAAGFLVLYLLGILFAWVIARLRGRALDEVAFGFGDVTLAGLIGLAVGWPGVVVALFLGVLAAGLFSMAYLVWMLARRRYVAFLPIPYGPFLIAGALFLLMGGRSTLERLFL